MPLLIDQRVAGDAAGDRDARTRSRAGSARARPRTSSDACDDEHARRRPGSRLVPCPSATTEISEHEHRRPAAGDRVDDRERRSPVRGREQCEVRQLEQPARRRATATPPASACQIDDGDRQEDDLGGEERDGRCSVDIRGAGEEQVPQRVGTQRRRERRRELLPACADATLRSHASCRLSSSTSTARFRTTSRCSRASTKSSSPSSAPRSPRRVLRAPRGPHRRGDVHALARSSPTRR